jgi:CheY-like chemotaxis protein
MIRVLAIDRDPLIRQTIRRALTRPTYAVSLAESGSIGVERYRRGLHDLVIADELMPGREGALTIIELRALAPLLPILVISADGRIFKHHQLLERARELGATPRFQASRRRSCALRLAARWWKENIRRPSGFPIRGGIDLGQCGIRWPGDTALKRNARDRNFYKATCRKTAGA